MTITRTTVAGRAVIRYDDRLLLVTDGGYWYTPGGRMEPGETLPECVAREVQEETGTEVTVGDIVAVSEFLDPETGEHKVECFFSAELTAAPDAIGTWHDTGGPVRSVGLFDAAQLAAMIVHPAWIIRALAEGTTDAGPIYLASDQFGD
ncbi:MAG: NUDIX domain-containing protein [Nocardioides sp.]